MAETPDRRAEWEEKIARRRARWEEKMLLRRQRWESRGMRGDHFRTGFGGAFVGLIVVGIGVLLLLQNLGIVIVDDLWDYWPVILIVFGLMKVLHAWGFAGRVAGGIVMFVGAVFLLRNLGLIHGNVWNLFWPVILIGIGLALLLRAFDRGNDWHWWAGAGAHPAAASRDASTLNAIKIDAIFSGANRRFDTQEFEGGEVMAVFGGVDLDLRKTAMKGQEVRIECNAIFGGIEIRVPETWLVIMRGTGIFGGFADETLPPPRSETKSPVLLVTGAAIFGGVNVKN